MLIIMKLLQKCNTVLIQGHLLHGKKPGNVMEFTAVSEMSGKKRVRENCLLLASCLVFTVEGLL